MDIKIDDASLRLLDEFAEIEQKCFKREAFSTRHIGYLLSDYNSISLYARVDGKIAGFIIGQIVMEGVTPAGHILTIDVAPLYRRKGIAERLLKETEAILRGKGVKECLLEVREDNVAALKLYEKLGYRKVAKLENYYKNAHGLYLKKILQ
jgi:ribosomal-protein-alanine N-acetyltransferase